jgi:hypothetical protein
MVLVAGGIFAILALAFVGIAAFTPGVMAYTQPDFPNTTFILAPAVRPELFVECVDNPYFPLIPGTVYTYNAGTDEGTEVTTVTVTSDTKEILGIPATVVRDSVSLDGELIEDTFDWFAQDDRGNVWYLGEDTKEYENGEVVSTEGSWEAGVDGAVAGIIMEGEPRVGDIYYQEFYAKEAEDQGAVLSLSEAVTVPFGSFENVLMTADYNPLDKPPSLEHKFYAPDVGLVKTVAVDGGPATELVSVTGGGDQDKPECGEEDDDEARG